MNKTQKTIVGVIALLAVGTFAYYVVSGRLNFSPQDAEGSGITGVKKADKYRSGSTATVDLEGAEVQQLLQNDQFQQLMSDRNFRELMKSPTFTDLAKNAEFMELARSAEFMELMKNDAFIELAKNSTFLDLAKAQSLLNWLRMHPSWT